MENKTVENKPEAKVFNTESGDKTFDEILMGKVCLFVSQKW